MPQGAFGHAQKERERQEEERKRREEEKRRREQVSYSNSEERALKKANNGGKLSCSIGRSSGSQSLVTTTNGGDGDGSSTNQSRANSRPHSHNRNSDWPIRNLNSEVGRVVLPKSKMFEGVKELIKTDLSTEEGIGKAINLLVPLKFSDRELESEVMEVASQAQLVQKFMERAKDGQNKLRSSLVELLISSRL